MPVGKIFVNLEGDNKMISKVSYEIRRTLPGKQEFDYEKIGVEVINDEGNPMTGEDMLKQAMTLCRTNTAMYQAQKKARK